MDEKPSISRAEAERNAASINSVANVVTQAFTGIMSAVSAAYGFAAVHMIRPLFSATKNLKAAAEKIKAETGVDGYKAIAAAQAKRDRGKVELSYEQRAARSAERGPDFLLSADAMEGEMAKDAAANISSHLRANLTGTSMDGFDLNNVIDLPPASDMKAREEALRGLREKKEKALKMAEEALGAVKEDSSAAMRSLGMAAGEEEKAVARGGFKSFLTWPVRTFKELPASGKTFMIGLSAAAGIGGWLWQKHKNHQVDAQMEPEIQKALDQDFGQLTQTPDKAVLGKHTGRLAQKNPDTAQTAARG
jgi:hypothetical protein